ncbi:MAG TPA: type II toxin-antitoxin system CcdA family antitoxin [Candidatus Acidoferrales bacterium]|nr:type II toxin-antitoxin system CcdA family antitoxin [Candidatus Acidoferrales bacterium]
MSNQTSVCAKIPADLKKKLIEFNINASAVMREALQTEVKRKEKERLRKLAEEAGQILQKIPAEEIVESIRASRDSR